MDSGKNILRYTQPVLAGDKNKKSFFFQGRAEAGKNKLIMIQEKFSLQKRAGSFRFAFDGLIQFFKTQHNAIVHLAATLAVITLSVVVQLPLIRFLFVVIATGLVWMAELFNTAIEKLCDMVCTEQHPQIKFIKDVSAAAVLVTAIIAIITGCIIFIPAVL